MMQVVGRSSILWFEVERSQKRAKEAARQIFAINLVGFVY